MIVMITVGPAMATLTAIMTCVFHAAMQEIGIEMLVGFIVPHWSEFISAESDYEAVCSRQGLWQE